MPLNDAFGWVWVLAGLLSGVVLGLRFHREDWFGGYGSFRRRLIRLGHVSFVGLGFLNILFAAGAARLSLSAGWLSVASWALIVGAVTMPLCCGLMAWKRGWHPLFALPVTSLILGVGLVVLGAIGP